MQVGAVGSISSLSAMPYIYNTNRVSSASLNKVSAIQGDTQSGKTDFSGLTSGETTNPLKRGETSNFVDVLAMQFSMAKSNASRTMKNSSNGVGTEQADSQGNVASVSDTAQSDLTGNTQAVSDAQDSAVSAARGQNTQGADNLYKMNQAINAYSLNMTA